MTTLPFKFSLRPGDLINALAGVKHACETQKAKASLYLGLNIQWQAVPELQVGRTNPYTLTEDMMEQLRPLLLQQPYIQGVFSLEEKFPDIYHSWCELINAKSDYLVNEWYKKHLIIDLDRHHVMPIGLPAGNLFRSNFYVYPDMACDLSKPWLDVEPIFSINRPIVINRTERCHNSLRYDFMQSKYPVVFVGLQQEYQAFCKEFNWTPQWMPTTNILDLARVIKVARFFVGNQSLAYSLAEAMKVPRVLEICPALPNVIPSGENAYDVYFQHAMEYYVNKLDATV